jgi:hypothetical protein
MKVGLFEARCAECDTVFAKPELGDFAYGQYLFTGERGTVYAYFEAIEHPVWARFSAVLPASKDRKEQGLFITAACAHFADPVQDQRLLNQHVCPQCLSHNLASWDGPKRGEVEVPTVSFSTFTSLSQEDQTREAKMFYAEFEAQQAVPGDAAASRRRP